MRSAQERCKEEQERLAEGRLRVHLLGAQVPRPGQILVNFRKKKISGFPIGVMGVSLNHHPSKKDLRGFAPSTLVRGFSIINHPLVGTQPKNRGGRRGCFGTMDNG